MKKNLKTILSAAAVLFASCQNEQLVSESSSDQTVYASDYVATTESYDAQTKTSLDSDGNVLWKTGDQLTVFDGNTTNQKYQVTDESNGKTSANLDKISGGGYTAGVELPANIAYYPYSSTNEVRKGGEGYNVTVALPATQTYAPNSFGNGSFPMVAVTNGTSDKNLAFKNVLGGLKLQLKGTVAIRSISVTGNNDEKLYGAATVTASNGSNPTIVLSDASAKTVTLDCGESGVQLNSETATNFVISLPPMTMTGGFTIDITDTDGGTQQIKTTKSQTITRSNLLKMPVVTVATVAPNPTHNGYEYVDLGLPSGTLWATMNVGATAPEGYGDYFAWGATEPYYEAGYAQENPQAHWKLGKSAGYALVNAPYQTANTQNSHATDWTKYLGSTSSIYKDLSATDANALKTILDPEDDAAHVNWGGNWRMPTKEEQDELLNNCDWTLTSLNGVDGYKVQSTKPGYTDNWIFLPATGFRIDLRLEEGVFGSGYCSSSLYSRIPESAHCLDFFTNSVNRGIVSRGVGLSVRPVYSEDPNCGITGISLNKPELSIEIDSVETLIATVSKIASAVNTQVEWSSSNSKVATVDYSGIVTAVSAGTATITAKTVFGGFTATCMVTVTPYQYVDLGLSVKWATFNVGATKPEEYGDYFAWGATEPLYEAGYALEDEQQHWKAGKSDGYTWVNTPYQTANIETWSSDPTKWTKYLGSTSSSYKDPSATDANARKTVLDPEDDAAHVNWGGSWRMPTKAEQDELLKNCTWTRTTLNGVNGYMVQSKKDGYTDKWIFLPATPTREGSFLIYGDYFYWSRSLDSVNPDRAYLLDCYSEKVKSRVRYLGLSVRPVCP